MKAQSIEIESPVTRPLGKNRAALAAIVIALVSLVAAIVIPYISLLIAIAAVPFGIIGLTKPTSPGARLVVIGVITLGIVGNVAAILGVTGMGNHSS